MLSILESGDKRRITVRGRVYRDWSDLFPNLFITDLYTALSDALSDAELNCQAVHGMAEPGEVYEFIFKYQKRSIYSKINLCPDGRVVIIYSAHRPLKGDKL